MPDYQQGKIYTIRSRNDDTLIYVGSTIQTLAKRWGGHKTKSVKCPNMLLYSKIDNKWGEWYIELYELYPCNSKMELEKREGEVIREISTLNKRIEGRTKKEYKQQNADKIKEYNKEYYSDNIDKRKEYYQQNYYKIKEQQKEYKQQNNDKIKEQRKNYRQQKAEKIKEKNKEYRQQNADRIKEYKKQYYLRKKAEQEQQNI